MVVPLTSKTGAKEPRIVAAVTQRKHAGEFFRWWSGEWELAGKTSPARPCLIAEGPSDQVVVRCSGALDRSALSDLAATLRALRDRSVVWLVLDSTVGELNGLRNLVETMLLNRNLIACIRRACGPALYVAMLCEIVSAIPAATIGRIGCVVRPTVWGCDRQPLRAEPALTECLAADLRAARPSVPHETWMQLANRTINGERAEQLGIVGALRHEFGDKQHD
jgi:hypothetical protein